MQFAYTNCKRIEKSVAVKLLLFILFSDIKKKQRTKSHKLVNWMFLLTGKIGKLGKLMSFYHFWIKLKF